MKFKKVTYLSRMPKYAGMTCGYWRFTKKKNKGKLIIYFSDLKDWRFNLAVAGHECAESLWCWLRGITTETCDTFDALIEKEYEAEIKPLTAEGGFDPRCPYRVGHVLGFCWEYFIIHVTFASWPGYDVAANKFMHIKE